MQSFHTIVLIVSNGISTVDDGLHSGWHCWLCRLCSQSLMCERYKTRGRYYLSEIKVKPGTRQTENQYRRRLTSLIINVCWLYIIAHAYAYTSLISHGFFLKYIKDNISQMHILWVVRRLYIHFEISLAYKRFNLWWWWITITLHWMQLCYSLPNWRVRA